jgi:hypothetical protein
VNFLCGALLDSDKLRGSLLLSLLLDSDKLRGSLLLSLLLLLSFSPSSTTSFASSVCDSLAVTMSSVSLLAFFFFFLFFLFLAVAVA